MNLSKEVKIRRRCTTVHKREDDDQDYDYSIAFMCVVVDLTAFVYLNRLGQKSSRPFKFLVGTHVAGAIEDSAYGEGSLALL